MLAIERRNEILEKLQNDRRVVVSELELCPASFSYVLLRLTSTDSGSYSAPRSMGPEL